MEKEKLETMLIDYIDGKLDHADSLLVEQELAKNEAAATLYEQLCEVINVMEKATPIEPADSLRRDFDKFLKSEIERTGSTKPRGGSVFFQTNVYRIAAGIVLVLLAVSIAYQVNKNNRQEQELVKLKTEMETTKQVMMAMLDNQQSASQRMVGATVAYKMETMDDEIVRALARSMNEDQNTNVRLAALEALSKFHQEPTVRGVLIESLSVQKDPVVQIALIQLLVQIKVKSVVKDLEQIADDPATLKAVKDEAYSGIMKLS
ncbi:MAG: HEAT repeat domain-containing protein [Bacteroidia bacterium]|nr:HEAT repeat domain-containing protein [Bacteroidia bacterium]